MTIRAAEYVRMSTEHQQYSTENQSDMIREYARKRGFEIVRTFTDAGKSGLRIDGRDALKTLIDTVQTGKADFTAVLVYDVSRWGRFQDADESAYYEYESKRSGIQIVNFAEQFENDGSPVSTIVKGVKRAMAGEYSRELSAKVFKGQCRLIELGFRQGGPAGYGLRRMLVDQAGAPKSELAIGEQKSIQTDRVVLVPGPEDERAVVRRIYDAFVAERQTEREIAHALNREGLVTDRGRAWTRSSVREILTNEKYIGNNVYNRISFKLKKKRVRNPPEMWVRHDEAFAPIVDPTLFQTASKILVARHRRFTDEEMLAQLRALLAKHGKLSSALVDETEGIPSAAAYQTRFGSLIRAYGLVDYATGRDYGYVEANRKLRTFHPQVINDVMTAFERVGGDVEWNPETEKLTVNGMFSVSIVLSRFETTDAGAPRWRVRLDQCGTFDLTVAVRMDGSNEAPLDYYIFPSIDVQGARVRLAEENEIALDTYRYTSLDYLFGMAEQVSVEDAA